MPGQMLSGQRFVTNNGVMSIVLRFVLRGALIAMWCKPCAKGSPPSRNNAEHRRAIERDAVGWVQPLLRLLVGMMSSDCAFKTRSHNSSTRDKEMMRRVKRQGPEDADPRNNVGEMEMKRKL